MKSPAVLLLVTIFVAVALGKGKGHGKLHKLMCSDNEEDVKKAMAIVESFPQEKKDAFEQCKNENNPDSLSDDEFRQKMCDDKEFAKQLKSARWARWEVTDGFVENLHLSKMT
ncbi:uncharacterized protein LOC143248762 [Tachypleus tridentatus]|uniref:uncharacterized protein LOC143248762 n=1 Tax=Tachypleus tridentatus TaxID=6853 RepID=UPI003FCF0D62